MTHCEFRVAAVRAKLRVSAFDACRGDGAGYEAMQRVLSETTHHDRASSVVQMVTTSSGERNSPNQRALLSIIRVGRVRIRCRLRKRHVRLQRVRRNAYFNEGAAERALLASPQRFSCKCGWNLANRSVPRNSIRLSLRASNRPQQIHRFERSG